MSSPPSVLVAPPRPATRREWWGLAVLVLPTLLLALDMTVLHLAAPHLSADLRPSSSELLWILDIYGFMIAGFLVTMGTLGDRIGRRRLLLAGAFAFGVASVLAALSTSAAMLIATRALLGIAGATLMPSTLSLIRNMFHVERERTVAITVWMTGFIVGSAIGPLVGGALLEYFPWGSVFLLGVPVMLVLLVAGPLLLPEFRDDAAGPLDLPSALLCVGMLLAVIFGIKSVARDGITLQALAAIGLGLAVGVMFVRRQRRLAQPMFDLGLFANRGFSVSVVAMLLTILALSGTWLMVFQYLQGVLGLSPLDAGIVMLPPALLQVAASMWVPRLARRHPPERLVSAGLLLALPGFVAMMLVGGPASVWLLVGGTSVLGVGVMPMMILGTDLVVGAAPPNKTGAAAATSETATELGMALGIAIIGSVGAAIYRGRMLDSLPAGLPPELAASAVDTLGGALGAVQRLPGETGATLLHAAREAFSAALHVNAVIGAAIMLATALIAALFLRRAEAPVPGTPPPAP
ncbi:MFS transporter [Thauera linaloolentis]|uniref:Major facilitator family transporter n=1 Tax=Thauera linaloolentis (strain DSM 12138 / JCM 21573 / CCUG 41526 / CIP 105981 / IAM 15112 / NBRC 102519 / 47Lol) TaxID=1123367 RepID=N6YN40_THAL4|nr:MFS transporter [Thauera linaloolentis]ENO83588.1 major facilitator family transporter [Thauera linaloolentis 47Lol = DSM 12138]MCM8567501.1 MFS transporter [Thauera linaloolentis]